jgi:hypothetical protein
MCSSSTTVVITIALVNVVTSTNVPLENMIVAVILFVKTIQVLSFVIARQDSLVPDVTSKRPPRMNVMLVLLALTLMNVLLVLCELSVEPVKKMKIVLIIQVATAALARMALAEEKTVFVTTLMSAMVMTTVVELEHIVSIKYPGKLTAGRHMYATV